MHIIVGVSIIRDQFEVGDSAAASCNSDNQAIRMEWLRNGTVVAAAVSTQQLDLEFSPVNDSIHNQVYVCRVTREGDVQVEQSFNVRVDGKNILFLKLNNIIIALLQSLVM
jgi:hypothetical protein